MINGISQQMNQRVAYFIDHRPIHFRFFPLDNQIDLFAEAVGQIPHHTGKTVEHIADGNHAQFHHNSLQISSYTIHLFGRFTEFLQLIGQPNLLQAGFVDHQLAHQV